MATVQRKQAKAGQSRQGDTEDSVPSTLGIVDAPKYTCGWYMRW